ncbi:MAG: hypothetical protein US62_C0007G0018 [Candidatus Woesebacteria bacterium GW2011_GWA1_37_8]|uniref:Phenylacetate-CoA ligase n=2 Tax=Candidatus Woeseibacteriota TaxID=1752722 RepID=A0A0G0LH56_9BACT|nr:MAG: hypothetical protein US39_C0001G0100 [Microgenomates group bacterium GW2011_GWC1_37_12b]KKQ45943.1 MAG: hypothetical protein US62_C0007G0018 [Candidatus Woesebacteria bacterium GW2011_GWA1_37_8]KKQ87255.1 MAG: hypothetical protein UT10_C0008G0016 [Candidatus Woesebacteria bacterium GW2011_GWB1_38_8b]
MGNNITYNKLIRDLENRDSSYWMRVREKEVLDLFNRASKNVPAYKKFLKDNEINSELIRSWSDFQKVPFVNKENYLKKYRYNELYWNGSLKSPFVYTATSGSTGEPFYFARNEDLDYKHSIITEEILRLDYSDDKTPILFVDAFGMGIWIGGLINYKAMELVAKRENLPISIVTPGINKNEIINIFRYVAPNYKQIIIAGYPPFIKDILDELEGAKINLGKYNMRIIFAAENITEPFRDYVAKKAKVKNIYKDIVNIYGSAELGAMAKESLLSTLVRRATNGNKQTSEQIYSQSMKTPTVAQFIPYFTNFEEVDGKVLVTGDSALPLIRYDIGDNGGVISYDEMEIRLARQKIRLDEEIKKVGLSKFNYKLPFVYIYERSDFCIKLHLHDIYPEIIRDALFSSKVNGDLTGKFTMTTKYNTQHIQYLELNLELKKGKVENKRLSEVVQVEVLHALKKKASGPGNINELVKKPGLVEVFFWAYEDPTYFKPGTKQKWITR